MNLFSKNKIKRTVLYLSKKFSKKHTLARESIVINTTTWKLFDKLKYNASQFDLICVNGLYEIDETSYDKIVAYIGGSGEKGLLKKLTNLRWLQIPSHGFNGFDKKAIYSKDDIVVTNMHGVFSEPIANFCITAWHVFHCPAFHKIISKTNSLYNDAANSKKMSVMIYGLGDIGNAIAQACSSMSWEVYGVKRTIPNSFPDYIEKIISFEDSINYLSRCDYVINVLPETPETNSVFDLKFFSKMKQSALFCNVGRGSSVVDKDLEYAVQEGIIKGAVLDAANPYSYNHPNIILTNHSSSFSAQNNKRVDELFSIQLKNFLSNGTDELLYKIPLE